MMRPGFRTQTTELTSELVDQFMDGAVFFNTTFFATVTIVPNVRGHFADILASESAIYLIFIDPEGK
jgi:hypothetical protein